MRWRYRRQWDGWSGIPQGGVDACVGDVLAFIAVRQLPRGYEKAARAIDPQLSNGAQPRPVLPVSLYGTGEGR